MPSLLDGVLALAFVAGTVAYVRMCTGSDLTWKLLYWMIAGIAGMIYYFYMREFHDALKLPWATAAAVLCYCVAGIYEYWADLQFMRNRKSRSSESKE
jgi:uncharacterized membrane protein HdeD (DUF308 family)